MARTTGFDHVATVTATPTEWSSKSARPSRGLDRDELARLRDEARTAGQLKDAARRPERVERVRQLGAAGKIEALVKVLRGEGTVVGTLFGQELVLN